MNDNPISQIFLITDYEQFYRNPVGNGDYMYVERDLLHRNWIDREDLIFTWEKKTLANGNIDEGPVIGSHKDALGALKDLIQTLRDNAP